MLCCEWFICKSRAVDAHRSSACVLGFKEVKCSTRVQGLRGDMGVEMRAERRLAARDRVSGSVKETRNNALPAAADATLRKLGQTHSILC